LTGEVFLVRINNIIFFVLQENLGMMDKGCSKINNYDYQPKIAIIAFPWPSFVPYKFLSDILIILQPIAKKIIIITGNTSRITVENKVMFKDLHIHLDYFTNEIPKILHNFIWILKSIIFQIKGSIELINSRKEVDIVIFYVAYPYFLLILITAKILRKKTLEIITRGPPTSFIMKISNLQNIIILKLLDGISPESPQLINILNLKKYSKKLLPDGARFIDILKFNIYNNIKKRDNIIGFVSRLEKEKGIEQFVEAIPLIFKEIKNVKFYIVGSGSKLTWIRKKCLEYQTELGVEISIFGWVDENLPDILNEIKLVILPSSSEGLPTIVLESMSCGTPVLATNVGGIPDIIEDNVTGFLMKDNSPNCIALHSIKALKYSDIEKISENGRNVIVRKYSYEACIERYKNIIQFSKRDDIY
jgi:glycosyltransferase involved in cell wall biosynthesis